MRTGSSLGRGFLYGCIIGSIPCILVLIAAYFGNESPVGSLVLAGGGTVLFWGSLGFLAGYASNAEIKTDASGHSIREHSPSLITYLVYRLVAGFLLSFIAGAIVFALGFFVLWQGEFLAPLNRTLPRQEKWLTYMGFCGFFGAGTGTVTGCWIGALLARGSNELGPVATGAFMTALFGAVAGGWLGALIGLFDASTFKLEEMAVLAMIAGALAGIAAAVLMRMRNLL